MLTSQFSFMEIKALMKKPNGETFLLDADFNLRVILRKILVTLQRIMDGCGNMKPANY